jgi:hypothetical protein
MTSLITPRILWIGMIVQAVILSVIYSSILISGAEKLNSISIYFPAAMEILTYFIASVLYFGISSEYKNNKLMRLAWVFLGMNVLISMGRSVVELPFWNSVWEGYYSSGQQWWVHQVVILIANSFLLLGLSVMGLAFKKSGLGFVIGLRGYIEIALILILTIVLLSTVNDPFPIGLIILSIAAMASVVLHKMALQMGGGKLAVALRLLTLYTLMRATFVLIEHSIGLNDLERRQNIDILMVIDLIVWRFVPWVAALAAAYRAELTVHAQTELKRQRNLESATVST